MNLMQCPDCGLWGRRPEIGEKVNCDCGQEFTGAEWPDNPIANFIKDNPCRGTRERVLFQQGDFTLASGAKSRWKIECDALMAADWDGLAAMAMEFLPPFGAALGVPRGGIPLANALEKYARTDSQTLLIVDDVWTTGGSMRRYLVTMDLDIRLGLVVGLVAFARNPVEPWVTALFQMPGKK